MTEPKPQPAVPPPERPSFQFSLRTLLLLFVVLGSSLAVFGAWGIVVFGLVVVLAIYLHQAESYASLGYLALAVLCLMCLLCCGVLFPASQTAREAARRASCANNMKQIMLALHNYHAANGCFPLAYIADTNGKPMHSWRVLILPYLGDDALYKLYNFNEPWDGPNNKKLSLYNTATSFYACPSNAHDLPSGVLQTNYLAVVGSNAAWAGAKPRKLSDFGKEADSTIMIVEVANSGISWMEPKDLSLDALKAANANSPVMVPSSIHGRHSNFFVIDESLSGANVAMANGSVNYLPPGSISEDELPKILQIGGCRITELESHAWSGERKARLNWPNIAALAVWLLSVGLMLVFAVRNRKTPLLGFPILLR